LGAPSRSDNAWPARAFPVPRIRRVAARPRPRPRVITASTMRQLNCAIWSSKVFHKNSLALPPVAFVPPPRAAPYHLA